MSKPATIAPAVAGRIAPPEGPAALFCSGGLLPDELQTLKRLPALRLDLCFKCDIWEQLTLNEGRAVYWAHTVDGHRVYTLGGFLNTSEEASRTVLRLAKTGQKISVETRCVYVPLSPLQPMGEEKPSRPPNAGSFRPGAAPLGARAKWGA